MTLRKVLTQMLADARAQMGRGVVRSLSNGLKLEITQQADGTLQLTLERAGAAPTDDDWQAITSRWPELLPSGVVPAVRREGRRFTMTGRWARPAAITEAAA